MRSALPPFPLPHLGALVCLALGLGLASSSGCKTDDPSGSDDVFQDHTSSTPTPSPSGATPQPTVGAPSAPGALPRLALAPLAKTKGASAGRGRYALLVVADSYGKSEWDLKRGPQAIAALRQALAAGLKIDEDDVSLLRGKDVTPVRVKRALATLSERIRGDDNLVFVYYYGHGVLREGAYHLFTYDTEASEQALSNTLPHAALRTAMAQLRAQVQKSGGDVRLVSVIDACRDDRLKMGVKKTGVFARAKPEETLAALGGAEVFSSSPGQPAEEGVFYEAFAAALTAAARSERVELGAVLGATREAIVAGRFAQRPEVSGNEALVLYRKGGIPLRVEVYDQEVGQRALKGAEVTLNGRPAKAPATFGDLGPGKHFLKVRQPGYFWRDEDLDVRAQDAGSVIRVGLLPRFEWVVGDLQNPHGTVAEVGVVGVPLTASIEGYHQSVARVTGSGSFALKLPNFGPEAELTIKVAGRVLFRRKLAQAGRDHVSIEAGGQRPIRVGRHDLGTFDLGQAAKARDLADLGQGVALGEVVLPNDLSFVSLAPQRVYERAQAQVTRGTTASLRVGLRALAGLQKKHFKDARSAKVMEDLVPRVRLQYLLRLRAEKPQEASRDLGAALTLHALGDMEPKGRETMIRWLNADAATAERAGDLPLAIARISEALQRGPQPAARTVLEARLGELWLARCQAALQQALSDDSWPAADKVLTAAALRLPKHAGILREVTRLGRERMSRRARESVEAGHKAYAAGELEEAEGLYLNALPACNAHYRGTVETQLADLRQRLFAKYYSLADDHFAGGDGASALRAYLRAWAYEPELVTGVLQEFPVKEPKWRKVYESLAPQAPTLTLSPTSKSILALGEAIRVRVESKIPVEVQVGGQRATYRAGAYELKTTGSPGLRSLQVDVKDVLGRSAQAHVLYKLYPAWVKSVLPQHRAALPGWSLRLSKAPPSWALKLSLQPPSWALAHAQAPPRWALARAPQELPLPLPAGVKFSEREGEYLNTKDASVLVWIPPGSYPWKAAKAKPGQRMKFAQGYFMGKLEVSWRQYRAFCAATKRALPAHSLTLGGTFVATLDHPVFNVSWTDANAYCTWAGLRLPSEAEWDYAATGPERRRHPWGGSYPLDGTRVANVADESAQRAIREWPKPLKGYDDGHVYPSPRGSFPAGASPFGCLDMRGNVWEWCLDAFDPSFEGVPLDGSPRLGPTTGERVVRGGSWSHSVLTCLGSCRAGTGQDLRYGDRGFRVARSLLD